MNPTPTINAFNLCLSFLTKESQLYDKAIFSEKHFKLTDTRDTNFDIVENRLAYTYKFGCYNIFLSEKCISKFLSECSQADTLFPFENLKVCSLSNGPGLDIVGLLCALSKTKKSLKGFPQLKAVNLYKSWSFLFRSIVRSAYEVISLKSFIQYFHIPPSNIQLVEDDVYSTSFSSARCTIEQANVLLMFRVFASTKANSEIFNQTLKEIFTLLKPGSLIFFIGNKNNTKLFAKKSDLGQYVKCIYGPQKVSLENVPFDEVLAAKVGAKPQVSGSAYFIVWQKRDVLVQPEVSKKKRRRGKKKTCKNVEVEKDNTTSVVGEYKDHDSDSGSEISFSSESRISDSLSDEMKSGTNSSISTTASFEVMKMTNLQDKLDLSNEVAYSVSISSPVNRTDLKDAVCKQKEPQDLLFDSYQPKNEKEDDSLKSTSEMKFEVHASEVSRLAHLYSKYHKEYVIESRKELDEFLKLEANYNILKRDVTEKILKESSQESGALNIGATNSFLNPTDPNSVTAVKNQGTESLFSSNNSDESAVTIESHPLSPESKKILRKETNKCGNLDTMMEAGSFTNSNNPDECAVTAKSGLLTPAINENLEESAKKGIVKNIEEKTTNSFFDLDNSDAVTSFQKEDMYSLFNCMYTDPDKFSVPTTKKEKTSPLLNTDYLDSSTSDKTAINENLEESNEKRIWMDIKEKAAKSFLDLDNYDAVISFLKEDMYSLLNYKHTNPDKFNVPTTKKEKTSPHLNMDYLDSSTLDKTNSTDYRNESLGELQQNFNLSSNHVLDEASHLEDKKLETSNPEKISEFINNTYSLLKMYDNDLSLNYRKSNNTEFPTMKERIAGESDLGSSQMTTDMACNTVATTLNKTLEADDIENYNQEQNIRRQLHNFYEDIFERNAIGEKNQTNELPLVMERSGEANKTNLNFSGVNSPGKILQPQKCSDSKQLNLKTHEDTCSKNSGKNKLQYVVKTKYPSPEMSGESKKGKNQDEEQSLTKCGSAANQSPGKLLNKYEKNVKSLSEISSQTKYDKSGPDINLFLQRCDNLITSLEKLTSDIKNTISSSGNGVVKCCCAQHICSNVQGASYVNDKNNCSHHRTSCCGTSRNNITLGSRDGPYIVIPLKNEDLMQILALRKS